jgi:4-amino-4-deoxy-L-arabinose transferase-like glycosyltransferase
VKRLEEPRGLALAGGAVALFHLLLLALIPRLPVQSDSVAYHGMAVSLTHGQGWLVDGVAQTSWMPGYSTFLALVYLVTGPSPLAAFAAQAALVGLDAALSYILVRRLLDARRASWAFLFVALTPVLVAYQGILASESLAFPLVLLFLEVMTRPLPSSTRGQVLWALWFGLVGGVLCFARADYALWMLAVPLVLLGRVALARVAGLTAVAAVVTALCLVPWVARNEHYHHEFILFTTTGGRALWLSAQQPEETEYGSPGFEAAFARCEQEASPRLRDACMSRDASRAIGEHRGYFLKQSVVRVARTLIGSHTDYLPGFQLSFRQAIDQRSFGVILFKGASLAVHASLALLAFVGLALRRSSPIWRILAFLLLSKLAVHAFLFGTSRYGVPLQPLLLLGALASLEPLLRRFSPAPAPAASDPLAGPPPA